MYHTTRSLRRWSERGFGLVELIVTVAILGVLTLIAIPVFGAVQNNARNAVIETELKGVGMKLAVEEEMSSKFTDIGSKVFHLGPRAIYSKDNDYMLVCTNASTYAIFTRSASGQGYVYSSATKATTKSAEFSSGSGVGGGATLCPLGGVPSPTGWKWIFDYRNMAVHSG